VNPFSPLLPTLAAEMRAAGVRRVKLSQNQSDALGFAEIELEPAHPDTIPAPGFDLDDAAPAEEKAAGLCAMSGCHEKAGMAFAPAFCERHGLQQLGVKV